MAEQITYRAQRHDETRRRFWLEFAVVGEAPLQPKPESESESTSESAPAVFHCFGRLPLELRNLVWKQALAQPRLIAVTCCQETDAAVLLTEAPLGPMTSTSEPPPLMLVCREAYALARRHYQRAFAWAVPYELDDSPDRARGPGCWFSFAHDTLVLRGVVEPLQDGIMSSVAYFLARGDTLRVRSLALALAAVPLVRGAPAANPEAVTAGWQLVPRPESLQYLFSSLFPIQDRFPWLQQLVLAMPRERPKRRGDEGEGNTGHTGNIGVGDPDVPDDLSPGDTRQAERWVTGPMAAMVTGVITEYVHYYERYDAMAGKEPLGPWPPPLPSSTSLNGTRLNWKHTPASAAEKAAAASPPRPTEPVHVVALPAKWLAKYVHDNGLERANKQPYRALDVAMN